MTTVNEHWHVYGSHNGPRTFYTKEEALAFYDQVCSDDWNVGPIISHVQVIRRFKDENFVNPEIETERLRNWKAEAMTVLTRWDEVSDKVPSTHMTLGKNKSELTGDYIIFLRDYIERLRVELAKHGWGDMHYGNQPQDPNIVALLEEEY